MSKAFIDRNHQHPDSSRDNDNQSDTLQKKIDPVAQLKWLNNQKVDQGWGVFNNDQPTQMFAKDEEEEAVQMQEDKEPTVAVEESTEEESVKASDVTISYASGVSSSKVKAHALTVIKEDAAKASVKSIKITSTYRSPETQMSAMYNNIESKGVEDQKKLYGSKGDKVIDAYVEAKKVKNATSATIQAAMLVKAKEIDFTSAHSKDNYESYNVIDISFKDLTDKEYKAFRKALDDDSRISKVLGKEESDPCLHVEISIP